MAVTPVAESVQAPVVVEVAPVAVTPVAESVQAPVVVEVAPVVVAPVAVEVAPVVVAPVAVKAAWARPLEHRVPQLEPKRLEFHPMT